MKKTENAVILVNDQVTENIYDMTIKAPALAQEAKAGQFIELYPDNGKNLLARPISICEADAKDGTIRLVYQVVGEGTKLFSEMKKSETIKVLGTCGNGFPIGDENEVILVGGGIGVPPLLETAKRIKGKKTVFLGFRSGSLLADEFEKIGCEVHIATDDGSVGFKGNVVELMRSEGAKGDVIYSCGPKIMLKFLSKYAQEKGIKCYVSMEERMACGIGACVGCVVKIKDNDDFVFKKVCKDGPVFDACEVVWE